MKNRVKVDLLIKNGQVVTASHKEYPARGNKMKHLEVIERGWVACAGDKIVAVGSEEEVSAAVEIGEKTQVIDATNQVVSPGLIDPHTHLVFGGSRG